MAKYKKLLGDFGYTILDWEKEFGGEIDDAEQYERLLTAVGEASVNLDPRSQMAFLGVKGCISYEEIRRTAELIEMQSLTNDAIRKRAYRALEKIKEFVEERWEWIMTGKK